MNKEMKMMFNAILEEIARVEERLEKKIDKLDQRMDLLYHEVNACKLEKDTITILLMRRMDQYENEHKSQRRDMRKK